MNAFSKKKIMSMITDLQDAVKTLKKEKEEVLDPIWMENMGMFLLLINMLREHFASQDQGYQVCVGVIDDFCREGEKITQGAPDWKERQQICKELSRLLKKLQFEAKKAVPEDKKELVFFPYLYAMWDSLESIWRAAVDSGEFEVSVVPIPYYERKADGTLGELHYDGAEYPPEVQMIPWESYDIAERKPHVAYVHNPYDDCNLVTSIHPNFYSEKIKPHVGSLVYVPYFVAPGDVVADHFCVTPVTLQADKIVAQSEKIQDCYVSHLKRFSEKHGLNWSQKQLAEKVLGLGSPKLDPKQSQDQAMETIPEQWRSVILKEDGSRKKVIFLNTSITTLLEFGPLALDRLEASLDLFFSQEKDIAVLWRPHPLIESTYQSMKPQLYPRYLAIVNKFKQGQWGILDQSKDFSRAVALSDAYYGDTSSVIWVFKEAGKPVMISNCNLSVKR